MASKFQALLDECRDELQAVTLFADNLIPIVTEFDRETVTVDDVDEIRDVQSLIQQALSDVGIVVVLTWESMAVDGQHVGESGPVYHNSGILVRALENPTVNATGVNRLEAIEAAVDTLHQFKPQTANAPLTVDAPGITRWLDPSEIFLGYDALFVTTTSISRTITQAATPTVTYEDLGTPYTVEMLCDTVGAAIYYTTNGKLPNPRIGTLYTGQFIAADPSLIKANAWLQGYLHSEVVTGGTAGTVSTGDQVTLAAIRAALIAGGGTFQLSEIGEPIIKSADDEYHIIQVTKPDDSVVADTGTVDQP